MVVSRSKARIDDVGGIDHKLKEVALDRKEAAANARNVRPKVFRNSDWPTGENRVRDEVIRAFGLLIWLTQNKLVRRLRRPRSRSGPARNH